MIKFDKYRALYVEAREEYEDIDRYIMERGWQDWMDGMDADQIADLLRDIYSISREGIIGMLAVDGTKLTSFCNRYCVPYNTAQKWKLGSAPPTEYTMIMLGYAVISNK